MSEKLFGNKGIDTNYEREIINYKPNLSVPKKDRFFRIDPSIVQKIIRAEDFTITKTLLQYDELIQQINDLLAILDNRNKTKDFMDYKKVLEIGKLKDIIVQENKLSDIRSTLDVESYTVLYRMKLSCEKQRAFLDQHYRNQITDTTDISLIEKKELEMIGEWVQAEHDFNDLVDNMDQLEEEMHDHDEEEGSSETSYLEQEIYDQDILKQNKMMLHDSLADTSYVHTNRYYMFKEIINQFQFIIEDASIIMKSDMHEMIKQIASMTDREALIAHLIYAFSGLKKDMDTLKGQYSLSDDNKEAFIAKQQWFYQQLESKSSSSVKNWLYNQNDSSESMNALANILVGSLEKSTKKYNSSVVDMSRFYQQEVIFYNNLLTLIQKKQENRIFLRILEDLQEIKNISNEWITSYLSVNGYTM